MEGEREGREAQPTEVLLELRLDSYLENIILKQNTIVLSQKSAVRRQYTMYMTSKQGQDVYLGQFFFFLRKERPGWDSNPRHSAFYESALQECSTN